MNDMKTMNIKSTDYREWLCARVCARRHPQGICTLYAVLCTLCSVLLISSCTHDEITPPVNTTNDALAAMPGDTRVGIKAEITDNREQSTTTRAEGDESATTYYALDEIHADMNVNFIMYLPGASDENNWQRRGTGTLNTLATTEPFSTLMLKDFNLTEGNRRPVSRWTVLNANNSGIDNLWGWARLTADATTGQPVLDYTMQRGNAKVTIIVQDENGQPVDVSGDKVTATVSLPETLSEVIYTPEGETAGKRLNFYLQDEVKTLAADEAIAPNRIALATYTSATKNTDFTLTGMVTADVNGKYGEQSNTLTNIVSATATHTTTDNITFTPIEDGPQFTDADKLTITVADDYSGLTSSQTGGTYSLKLSEVKLSDTENLTALEPGKHYTLTVTLRHNTLVAATATIGAWSTASASVNIGGDGAFMPSYEYDAATNTYTILDEKFFAEALKHRTENDPDATSTVVMNGVTIVPSGTSLKMEDGKLKIVNVPDYSFDDHLPAIIANGSLCVKVDGTCEEREYGGYDKINKMKSLIQSAIAKGVTGVYVTGKYLTKVEKGMTGYIIDGPQTVLGMAIKEQNIADGTINVFLPEVETIPDGAFNWCPVIIIRENIVTIPSTNQ